jgi:hypothetical protein
MSDVRTARLADELEIRNLVARLALLADRAPALDEYLALFTEDAVWEFSAESRALVPPRDGLRVEGRAAIGADRVRLRGKGTQGPGTNTYHINTTLAVRVLDDDAAEAESYWMLMDGKGEPKITRIGHYHDSFRRTPEGWKLARREVTPHVMW